MHKHSNEYLRLLDLLKGYEKCAVAFSGGIDSTLLLKAASDALGRQQVLALTADAPMHLRKEICEAKEIARQIGAEQIVIPLIMDDLQSLANNPPDRCYICKQTILKRCLSLLPEGYTLCEGSNLDDLSTHRPGWQAVQELKVKSPLIEAGFSKQQIRETCRLLGLDSWNKPAQSCLLTRFPHHQQLTPEILVMVEQAENWLTDNGLTGCRVRCDNRHARIELRTTDILRASQDPFHSEILRKLSQIGFSTTEIDPAGYRSGSMDQN